MSLHITWIGHACFKLQAPDLTVITDPLDKETGYSPPRTSADVVLVSSDSPHHSNVAAVKDDPIVFDSPGEYEVKGAMFRGVPSVGPKGERANTIFLMRLDDIRLCHLGALGEPLADEQIEGIGTVDVLFVPTGLPDAINAKHAMKMINDIDPRIVIPYGFKTKKATKSEGSAQDFLKEMGMTAAKTLPKALLKAKNLPADETDVLLLEAQG